MIDLMNRKSKSVYCPFIKSLIEKPPKYATLVKAEKFSRRGLNVRLKFNVPIVKDYFIQISIIEPIYAREFPEELAKSFRESAQEIIEEKLKERRV